MLLFQILLGYVHGFTALSFFTVLGCTWLRIRIREGVARGWLAVGSPFVAERNYDTTILYTNCLRSSILSAYFFS